MNEINEVEEKILKLSREVDMEQLSLRKIGKRIGVSHPQTVKNHILKLKRLGLLEKAQKPGFIKETETFRPMDSILYEIPILGYANCGQPVSPAEEEFDGFIRVSASLLRKRPNLFALVASGDSMNLANIDGESIQDGDYVIVDGNQRSLQNGDVVVSIIDGCANIKVFNKDRDNGQISLLSKSTNRLHSPIFIDADDFSSYMVNGKVVKVIKKPEVF